MTFRGLLLIASALQTWGCATGNSPPATDGAPPTPPDQMAEAPVTWPDSGPPPDAFIPADAPQKLDLPPPDAAPPPDTAPAPDSTLPCPDPYEPNNSCSGAKSIGTAPEGSTWHSTTATAYPAGDADWFEAVGQESAHTCMPFTSQTYYFRVKLKVPSGRKLRVCVYQDVCTESESCADNASAPGPLDLTVQYEVDGTCAVADDTTAKIMVDTLDGVSSCVPYTLQLNFAE